MSKQNGRGWFIPAGAALGLILAWALAKMLWVIGTLGYPLSNGGAAVLFRLEPGEYSFFGGVLGFVLGFWLLAKPAGLDRRKTLDALAFPVCLVIAAARFATLFWGEAGLGDYSRLGMDLVEDGSILAFFPLSIRDSWGDWWMGVGTLEALAALITGIYALRKRDKYANRPGHLFERCAVILCSVQLVLELFHSVSTITYFVHTEQVWCAVYILVRVIFACRVLAQEQGDGAWKWTVFTVLWVALNGVTQYMMDKLQWLDLLPEGVSRWVGEHLVGIGYGLIILSAVGLCFTGLRAGKLAADQTLRNGKAAAAAYGKDGKETE